MSIKYHSISEIPQPKVNPYVGVLFEVSIIPHIVLSSHYRDFINETTNNKDYPKRGALIGWFYIDDIMPKEKEYLELVHISAEMDYYKGIKI